MGEWMEQVPVKLPHSAVAEIDQLLADNPLANGRSTVIRLIVLEHLKLIREGIVAFAGRFANRVPGVLSDQRVQGVHSVPSDVVAAIPKKPPLSVRSVGGRGLRSINQSSSRLGAASEETAYASLSFPAKIRLPFAYQFSKAVA